MANIESYIVLQGDVASSEDLSDVTLSGAAEFEVLVRNGSSQWVNQTLATASLDNNLISNAKLRDSAAFSVIGNFNTGSNDPADIVAGTNSVLGRVAGDLVFAQIATAQIADDAVDFDKLLHASGESILMGRLEGSGAGPFGEITLGANLTLTGSVLAATGGGATALNDLTDVTLTSPATDSILIKTAGDYIDGLIVTNSITNNAVSYAKWQQLAGFSIPANPDTGTGDASDLTAGTNSLLGRVGGDLVFAQLDVAQVPDSEITLAKIVDAAADRLIGRGNGGGSGVQQEITLGSNLSMSGTTLNAAGAAASLNDLTDVTLTSPATDSILIKTAGDYIDGLIVTNSITNSAVLLAKIQDATANERILGSGAAGTGNPYTELTIGSSLSFSGTELSVATPGSAGLSGYVMFTDGGNEAVIADHTNRTPNGNARGDSAVDLQTDRSGATQVASGANSVICGGTDNTAASSRSFVGGGATNIVSGGSLDNTIVGGFGNSLTGDGGQSVISGGHSNFIVTAASGVNEFDSIGGGQLNSIEQTYGTVPGGRRATARRFGELAYGGATDVDAQRVMNVATALTTDASQTTLGYTNLVDTWANGTLDAATIPFPSSDTFMLAVEGYVIGMRANVAGDAAAAFKVEFAVKKNDAGAVSFVGNPKVSVVGRDDANLDCDVVLAGSNAGTNIRVTGIAAQDWVWCFEWEGAELLVPAL